MPIILPPERRALGSRVITAAIYVLLCIGGATMVYPFLITLSSSLSNRFDYNRFSPVPRSFHSRTDRFTRGLSNCFLDAIPAELFPDRPRHWTTIMAAGQDLDGIDAFAAPFLAVEGDPAALERWRRMAADYTDWFLDYDIKNTLCNYDFRDLPGYLEQVYGQRLGDAYEGLSQSQRRAAALALLNQEWGVPYEEFFDITLAYEMRYPMHHVSWDYPKTPKAEAFLDFKDAYRRMVFRPGAEEQWRDYLAARGIQASAPWPVTRVHDLWPVFKSFVAQQSPASTTKPFLLKTEWLKFLNRQSTRERLGLESLTFTVDDYNRLFDAQYERLVDVPFPVPASAPTRLQETWRIFVREYYPVRLMTIRVSPAVTERFHDMLRRNFKLVDNYNRLMARSRPDHEPVADFSDIPLPAYENSSIWRTFVRDLPLEHIRLHSAENAWQQYLLGTYGNLAGVNEAYGWNLRRIEEARIPFAEAYTITFFQNEWHYYLADVAKNFTQVFEFLFVRGRAFLNTVILVVLTILATLTVNPLAAYALSRFKLKWKEQILLFLLATMAFPAAVRAIPGFLLMRDLHLLNTYAALVLPGLANGMSIFILKCFFDGLPRELYEAAALDGAPEWQVFLRITLPMTTPILAINSLTAFIHAYNSWQWALIVCQDEDYWTLAVWLYQMQTLWRDYPYVIMAGFVIASIPTAIVFISCQKIILRGIVIPTMK